MFYNMEQGSSCCSGEVDKAAQKNAACGDDPTGKVQFANQGQKFSFETFVARRPALEFRY